MKTTSSKGMQLAMGLVTIAVLALVTTFATKLLSPGQMDGMYRDASVISPQPMMMEESIEPDFNLKGGEMGMGGVSSKMAYQATDSYMMPPVYPGYDDYSLSVENRLYEKYADFSVVTKDVQGYLRAMREFVLSVNGVVLSDAFSNSKEYTSGSLYVKVPVESFEQAAMRATEGVKEVYSSSMSSSDVTGMHQNATDMVTNVEEELTMVKAQLSDAQLSLSKVEEGSALWRQYRNEVLSFERNIRNLEKQLESFKQNVTSVETQVEYATLNITAADNKRYYEPMPYYNGGSSLWYHFENARASLGQFGYTVSVFLVWFLVYAVVWMPALVLFRLIKRKLSH